MLVAAEDAFAALQEAAAAHAVQVAEAQEKAEQKLNAARGDLEYVAAPVGSIDDLERVSCIRRENCNWGADCRRRNPRHFRECAHPGDWDWLCAVCMGTGNIPGIGACEFCKDTHGTEGPPTLVKARKAAAKVGKLKEVSRSIDEATERADALLGLVREHVNTFKGCYAAGDQSAAAVALETANQRTLEMADVIAPPNESTTAAAEALRKKLALFSYECKARGEAVPLKEKTPAAVDEAVVKAISPLHELPIELNWLQNQLNDFDLVECSLCRGSGLAGPGADLVRAATKRDVNGQLERALSQRHPGEHRDSGPVWLFETNGGGWGVFDPSTTDALEEARSEGEGVVLQVQVRTTEYTVDLSEMVQTNKVTGTVRRIRRVADWHNCNILESLQVKRRRCRLGGDCAEGAMNPDHLQFFAHPGDWDYSEPEEGAEEEGESAPSWFFQAEDGSWNAIEEGIAAHLEHLLKLPLTPPVVSLRLPPGGEHRIDVSSMKAVEVKTGSAHSLKRIVNAEDADRYNTNVSETNMLPDCEDRNCWVCSGTGAMSRWLDEDVVMRAHGKRESGDFSDYDCCVCYGEGQYALSAQCRNHFFCSDCIMGSLEAMLDSGQFPPFCPMCRAEAPHHSELKSGLVGDPELSFLQLRGIMDREFLFRFLKQAHQYDEGPKEHLKYFACPAKCGKYLMENDPSYAEGKLGEFFQCGPNMAMRLGSCRCGHFICIRCQGGETFAATHECPEAKAPVIDEATLKYLASIGKKCPACGYVIQKNDGCNLMMCGTTAHGKVADALRNGGCAYIFDWNSLKRIDDGHGYTDVKGNWVRGSGPVTDRQVLVDRPKTERW